MKRILISEEEKSRILESHNKVRDLLMGHLFDKSLLSEQNPGVKPLQGKALLEKAKTDCGGFSSNPNVVMGTKKAADGQTKDALIIRASQNYTDKVQNKEVFKAGDTMYYFPDMTYEVYHPTTDGKETLVYTNNWACKALNVVAQDIETRKGALIAAGWKDYNTLSAGDQQSYHQAPQLWDKIQIGSDILLFPKAAGQAKQTSDEAKKALEQYLGGTYGVDFKLPDDATDEERQVWDKIKIPKGVVFSQDVIVLRNPENTTIQAALQQSQQRRTSQLIDEKTCLSVLDDWYNSYLEDPNATSAEQTRYMSVYRCYNYFKNGRYKAGRHTTNLIKAMEGNSYDQKEYNAIPRTNPYNVLNVVKKVKADNPRQ